MADIDLITAFRSVVTSVKKYVDDKLASEIPQEQLNQITTNTNDINQLKSDISSINELFVTDTFTFTLEDGTEVVKEVYVKK